MKEKGIMICPECGSPKVQIPMWVRVNTNEIMDPYDNSDAYGGYCEQCGSLWRPVEINEQKRFLKKSILSFADNSLDEESPLMKAFKKIVKDDKTVDTMDAERLSSVKNLLDFFRILEEEYKKPSEQYDGYFVQADIKFKKQETKDSDTELWIISEKKEKIPSDLIGNSVKKIVTLDELLETLTEEKEIDRFLGCLTLCDDDMPF